MIPNREPSAPGEILLHEFLRPLKLSQRELAAQVGVQPRLINEIIKNKRAVTARTALLFAKRFKTTPQFWLNLQNMVDLYHARRDLLKAG